MDRNTLRLHVENRLFSRSIAIYAKDKSHKYHAVPTACKEGEYIDPIFELRFEVAQELMDELWRAGVRPAEIKWHDGETQATKYHLEDMRKIAFSALQSEFQKHDVPKK